IIDSVSWRVLLQDMLTVLGQHAEKQLVRLAPTGTSFRRHAHFLTEQAGSEAIQADAAFWISQGDEAKAMPLPVDHASGDNSRTSADSVWIELDEHETRELYQRVGRSAEFQ